MSLNQTKSRFSRGGGPGGGNLFSCVSQFLEAARSLWPLLHLQISKPATLSGVLLILHPSTLLLYIFFSFLATPHGLWDLSSPIRDQTRAPCIGRAESLTTGPPRESYPSSSTFKHPGDDTSLLTNPESSHSFKINWLGTLVPSTTSFPFAM